MNRYSDWAERLEAYLFLQSGRKFQYGAFDCCLFVCDAVSVMTGVDPAREFRGQYDSMDSAAALIRKYGQRSVAGIAGAVAASFGMREIAMARAGRGDVVLVKRGKAGSSLGLVALDGAHVLVPGAAGVGKVPRMAGTRAWAV